MASFSTAGNSPEALRSEPTRSTNNALVSSTKSLFLRRIWQNPEKRGTFCNDVVLLLSFAYSAVHLIMQWPEFLECQKPVGTWLVGSYALVSAFRILSYISQAYTPEGEEDRVLYIRQPWVVPKILAYLTWTLLLPCFCYWTVRGSFWVMPLLWDSNKNFACFPDGAHPWFVGFCQLLCYFWTLLYAAYLIGILRIEYRLHRAERALREIETQDSLRRWGRMSLLPEEQNTGFEEATGGIPRVSEGMEPTQIRKLPQEKLSTESKLVCGCEECAICITSFDSGDSARQLPGCGHTFHKECIDLWLLRSASCPLCKCGVSMPDNEI